MVSPRPSLTFAGKAGAVTVFYSEGRLLADQGCNVWQGERTSLLWYVINYDRKKFYITGPKNHDQQFFFFRCGLFFFSR
jgi:hypothetical protein